METELKEPQPTDLLPKASGHEQMVPIAQILEESYASAEVFTTQRPYKRAIRLGILWGIGIGSALVAGFLIVSS